MLDCQKRGKTMASTYKAPTFDFTRAISQLFAQPGGRDFAFRLILWTSIIMGVIFVFLAKPYLNLMGAMLESTWISNQNPEDPELALAIYIGMTKHILPIIFATLGMWALYASAETALHKRVFFDYDAGFIPLRFGADEFRVMGAQFMVYLMVFGVYISGLVLLLIAGLIVGATAEAIPILGVIIGILIIVGLFVFLWYLAYFSIRMAPAAALTVKNQRVEITGGWKITKKRAGNLFLAYLLIFIIGYVAISVIQVAAISSILDENYFALIYGLSEENPRVIFEQVAVKMKQPGTIIMLVLASVIYVVTTVVWWLSIAGVANYAVQWWDETNEPDIAE